MKKLYTWMVIRAFKSREPETAENLALHRLKQKRNRQLIKNVAIFLALSSILLLLIPFFMPGLKAHYKFSTNNNTASIMNTCSGCLLGICFLIIITLIDAGKNTGFAGPSNTLNNSEKE